MSKGRDRTVYCRADDGKWINKRNDAGKRQVFLTHKKKLMKQLEKC